ncbi:hypothetical protein DAPPUDRAFT_107279 [Daphnia pulex]|uniref:Uncharacterized protein n=1 Tax=Daphnia pulex TaxID=6669 RepID=E9GWL6_DAPPU|nr:hypothetical protein DAPPUDRAFT_107279 [Daphnia pulex]|eukprot:EFX76164.1 hypothetical protein DAPPUDRAFT_107279 [Daphnia pulex]
MVRQDDRMVNDDGMVPSQVSLTMAAVKQFKYQSRQLQELTLINSLRTLYMSYERAVSQGGASREVRDGKRKAFTIDERRPRFLENGGDAKRVVTKEDVAHQFDKKAEKLTSLNPRCSKLIAFVQPTAGAERLGGDNASQRKSCRDSTKVSGVAEQPGSSRPRCPKRQELVQAAYCKALQPPLLQKRWHLVVRYHDGLFVRHDQVVRCDHHFRLCVQF